MHHWWDLGGCEGSTSWRMLRLGGCFWSDVEKKPRPMRSVRANLKKAHKHTCLFCQAAHVPPGKGQFFVMSPLMHILLVDFLRTILWGNTCEYFVYLHWWFRFQGFFHFYPKPLRKWSNLTTFAYFWVGWVVEPPTRRHWLPVHTQEPLRLLEAASGQISKVHRERHTVVFATLAAYIGRFLYHHDLIYYLQLNYNYNYYLFLQSAKA